MAGEAVRVIMIIIITITIIFSLTAFNLRMDMECLLDAGALYLDSPLIFSGVILLISLIFNQFHFNIVLILIKLPVNVMQIRLM